MSYEQLNKTYRIILHAIETWKVYIFMGWSNMQYS